MNNGVWGRLAPAGRRRTYWTDASGAAPRLFLSLLLVFFIAACGKRPASVDSPAGRANDRFPHTYPDPGTDPKPGTDPGPEIP